MNKLIINNWDKFHNLTVLCETLSEGNYRVFKCKCTCWKIKSFRLWNLSSWNSKSCGCLNREIVDKILLKHGMSWTKFYKCYKSLKQRCYNKNNKRYDNYWGRWIINEWSNFEEFKKDMYGDYLAHVKLYGEANTTIEREKVGWNYCSNNCKWATYEVQAINKTNTILLQYNGEIKSLSEWCNILKLNYSTTYKRYRKFTWDTIKIFANKGK